MVSLGALRWLADQDAAFVMLDRNGKVIATTGPVRSSDVRLRRAQAVAHHSGVAIYIARELIRQKIIGQEHVVRRYFPTSQTLGTIIEARRKSENAKSSDELRVWESQAALAYWSAWHDLAITYPRVDLKRVPQHWQIFGARISPLTRSPRLAVNPPNAMLNYLYAILESETRLALAELGLDPGIGILHNDLRARDSLACDVMEPVRPQVDSFLLDWLKRAPLRRDYFFEKRDGNCCLMGSFATKLSESALIWRRAVAPYAEEITRALWSSNKARNAIPPTRLTQSRKREVKGVSSTPTASPFPRVTVVCQICGITIKSGFKYCRACLPTISRENVQKAAKLGRIATLGPEAQARRAESQRRQAAALRAWNPSEKPTWLDEQAYRDRVQPQLRSFTVPVIMTALSISEPYALLIRRGGCVPHPRHWLRLAKLVGHAN